VQNSIIYASPRRLLGAEAEHQAVPDLLLPLRNLPPK
jgi:hypothetical protein